MPDPMMAIFMRDQAMDVANKIAAKRCGANEGEEWTNSAAVAPARTDRLASRQ